MKKIYLTITLIFSCFYSFSHHESELFGNWYLQYQSVNGVISYPPLTTEEDYNIILNFGLLPPTSSNPFTIDSYGPLTDTFSGHFIVNNNTIEFNSIYQTLGNFCDHPIEVCNYFDAYNFNIIFDFNTEIETAQYVVDYSITYGPEADATLMITNTFNGNIAVYGRQALSLSENETITSIKIYPNPVETILNVERNSSEELIYNIFDLNGRTIRTAKLLDDQIDITRLQSGVYFIRFFNESNSSKTIKIVKL